MINGPYGTKVKVNLITLVCIINSALYVGLKEHINSWWGHGHFMQHSKYLQTRCSSRVSKRTFPAISGPENTASYIVFDIYFIFFCSKPLCSNVFDPFAFWTGASSTCREYTHYTQPDNGAVEKQHSVFSILYACGVRNPFNGRWSGDDEESQKSPGVIYCISNSFRNNNKI